MDHEMRVTCAWCGKHMRGPAEAARTSHGMCVPCHAAEVAKLNKLTVPAGPATWEEWTDIGGEGGGA